MPPMPPVTPHAEPDEALTVTSRARHRLLPLASPACPTEGGRPRRHHQGARYRARGYVPYGCGVFDGPPLPAVAPGCLPGPPLSRPFPRRAHHPEAARCAGVGRPSGQRLWAGLRRTPIRSPHCEDVFPQGGAAERSQRRLLGPRGDPRFAPRSVALNPALAGGRRPRPPRARCVSSLDYHIARPSPSGSLHPELVRTQSSTGLHTPRVVAGRANIGHVLAGGRTDPLGHGHPGASAPPHEVEVEVAAGGTSKAALVRARPTGDVGAVGLVLGAAAAGEDPL